MALPEPFNRTFNACAVRRITRAHGRAAPAAPLPAQCPHKRRKRLNLALSAPLRLILPAHTKAATQPAKTSHAATQY